MSELYNSKAWRAACSAIAAPGLPPVVPPGEMRWLSTFVGSVLPSVEADVSHLLNLPKPALRYRFAASYAEYAVEWLKRYPIERLNDSEAEELGYKAGSEATGVSGAYWPGNEEVWFVGPNLLRDAGPDHGDREATAYLVAGHEVVHGVLRQGVPWLRDYMNTVYLLSEPMDEAERSKLLEHPHSWIPPEAYASRRAAQSLWQTVRYSDEGTSEVMSWGVVDRGVDRGTLRPQPARKVLEKRVMSLEHPQLETYGTGVRLPAKAIDFGREGIDRFWCRPVTGGEVKQPELWVAAELSRTGTLGYPPATAQREAVSQRRSEPRSFRGVG